MCLIAFAIAPTSPKPLLVAANRDEAFARRTQALSTWQLNAKVQVASGRDMVAGGTWMGAASNGRVAWLTNIRPAPKDLADPGYDSQAPATGHTNAMAGLSSRGGLCTSWLGGIGFDQWLCSNPANQFDGCNLVLGDLTSNEWHFARNQASAEHELSAGGWYTSDLLPGVYALSNASLDTPWPKLLRLKEALSSELRAGAVDHELALLTALQDHRLLADHPLSSVFVRWPEHHYGTRSSSLMWLDASAAHQGGTLHIKEWRYDETGALLASPQHERLALGPHSDQ